MTEGGLLFLALLVLLCAMFVNGATDAPVLLSAPLLSGALTPRQGAMVSALCNGAGLVISLRFFPSVAETVGELARFGTRPRVGLLALSAVLLSAVVWAVAAWVFGIPTSESHALLAGLVGASVALGEGANILGASFEVLWGLCLSLAGGYLLCRLGLHATNMLSRRVLYSKSQRLCRSASVVLAAASSFLHGAQDGQKFTGLFLLALSFGDVEMGRGAFVLPVLALSVGSACVRGRILDTLGADGSFSQRGALVAELSGVLCLAACTVLGLPVSTTHLKSAALSAVRQGGRGHARGLVLTWLLTFPACFCLAFAATSLFLRL